MSFCSVFLYFTALTFLSQQRLFALNFSRSEDLRPQLLGDRHEAERTGDTLKDVLYRRTRTLTQQLNSSIEEVEACSLTALQQQQWHDAHNRRWIINEEALDEIADDVQLVLNCASDQDIILINTLRAVQPPRTATIRKAIVLSAFSRNFNWENGQVTNTRGKVSIACPSPTQGIFEFRHPNITIANIIIEDCHLEDGSPIAVDACDDSRGAGIIHLHHMRFQNNTSPFNASIMLWSRSSCSSLDLVDVVIKNNSCGEEGCFMLPAMASLANVTITRNKPLSEESGDGYVFVARNSTIVANNLQSSRNKCSALLITNTVVNLSRSEFTAHGKNASKEERISEGGAIKSVDSVVYINNCVFSRNIAQSGGAITSQASVLNITRSRLKDNDADQGGALSLSKNSTLLVDQSTFLRNRGSYGGSIYIQDSTLSFFESSIKQTNSVNLGSVVLKSCNGTMFNSSFLDNRSSSRAGGIALEASDVVLQNVTISRNKALEAGGLYLTKNSTLHLNNATFYENSASTGGALYSDNTTLVVKDTIFRKNDAKYAGGSALLRWSLNSTFVRCRFIRNRSEGQGGGISGTVSTIHVKDSRFYNNSAAIAGGAMFVTQNSTCKIQSTTFLADSSWDAGSIYVRDSLLNATEVIFRRSIGHIQSTFVALRSRIAINNSIIFQTVSNKGYAVRGTLSDLEIRNTVFLRNEATALLVLYSNVTVKDCRFVANHAVTGGGMRISQSVAKVKRSAFLGNSAINSAGAVHIFESKRSDFKQCIFLENSARYGSGVVVENATMRSHLNRFEKNRAHEREGGAFIVLHANLSSKGDSFLSNTATTYAGAIATGAESILSLTNAEFSNNSCSQLGGAITAAGAVKVQVESSRFTRNSAGSNGGALFIKDTEFIVANSTFRDNRGTNGGGVYIQGTNASVVDSQFESCEADESGGAIRVEGRANLTLSSCTFRQNCAVLGGALSLANSTLTGTDSVFTNNSATDGGAFSVDKAAAALFANFTFKENHASDKGGAVGLWTDDTSAIPYQMKDSLFQNNTARFGGALHLQRMSKRNRNCTLPSGVCGGVAIVNCTFDGNKGEVSGDAIQANIPSSIRFKCLGSSQDQFLSVSEFLKLPNITSRTPCASWAGSSYKTKSAVGSYARRVNIRFIPSNSSGNHSQVIEEDKSIRNVKSGDLLPVIHLVSVDEFGNGPAFASSGILNATLDSTDGFFPGEIPISLLNGTGEFKDIAGFKEAKTYHLRIRFNSEDVEEVEIKVQVRECTIDEQLVRSVLCEACDSLSYNFAPENTGCTPCPKHGDCSERFIVPESGYWHSSPCSNVLRRCLNEGACEFKNRTMFLRGATKGLDTCTVNQTMAQKYVQKQCKTGYTGVLCGACDALHGRYGLFNCGKCLNYAFSLLFILVAGLWLLLLAVTVIRGSLPSETLKAKSIKVTRQVTQVPERTAARSMSADSHIIEMVSRRLNSPSVLAAISKQELKLDTSTKAEQVETTKLCATESFKITVNHLQVIAIAATINVVWTDAVSKLLLMAENLGGLTTETVTGSVDCLLSSSNPDTKSLLRVAISLLVPLVVCILLAFFWTFYTIHIRERSLYLCKRVLLSAIVILHISYLGLTKLLVKVFYCVDVHDLADYGAFDSTSKYWAMDTSIKCYRGHHVSLIVVGLTGVVLIVFAFPCISAFISLKSVNHKDGQKYEWIFEIMNFMYRAFDKKYIYWESVILARKALLSIIAVFSYQLGGDVQSILASLVLVLALFLHMSCRPYKKVFSALNTYEAVALLVSAITFMTGQFFEADRCEQYIRIALSAFLLTMNLIFFSFMCLVSIKYGIKHLRASLEDEQISLPKEAKPWTVLKVCVISKLTQWKEAYLKTDKA